MFKRLQVAYCYYLFLVYTLVIVPVPSSDLYMRNLINIARVQVVTRMKVIVIISLLYLLFRNMFQY